MCFISSNGDIGAQRVQRRRCTLPARIRTLRLHSTGAKRFTLKMVLERRAVPQRGLLRGHPAQSAGRRRWAFAAAVSGCGAQRGEAGYAAGHCVQARSMGKEWEQQEEAVVDAVVKIYLISNNVLQWVI